MKRSFRIFKTIVRILLFLIFFLIIFIIFSFAFVSQKINQNPIKLATKIYNSYTNNHFSTASNFKFIILGLDERNDSLEKTETTDTIIFSSLNLKNQNLNLISLPRDIWDYKLNTKINGIYPLALQTNDTFSFIQNNYSEIIGQNIDKTIIITTKNLIELVKVIGGVDLTLEKGFVDTQYPNQDYIDNPSPQIPKYKTVKFESGKVHLDESNVTEFVRSRKGAETAAEGGTDIGRIQRQQLLINAIISKIQSPEYIADFSNIINLYNFWHQQIKTNINDQDLFSLVFTLKRDLDKIKINRVSLPIGNNPKEGVIYHPEKFINKQWVYTTSDKNYTQIKDYILKTFNN